MRIALDGRTIQDHFPGIARYTFNLAHALADSPQHILLLLYDPGQRNSRFDLSPLASKPDVQLTPVNAPFFSPGEQWRVPALLRRLRVEVYHSPYYIMPYRPGCPTVVTVHDLIPLRYPHYFTPLQRLTFRLTIHLAIRAARRVIAVSRATANDLGALLSVPSPQLVTIPEAVDPNLKPQPSQAIAVICARYELPDSYILYVGSNKPHKNLTRLVEAFADVARTHPSISLVIAGQWDARYTKAQQRAAELGLVGRVRWLGPIASADLPALYSGATLFVFPSEYEGFGLPVLEAMACGTPVTCSHTSSLPEVVGDAALYFDPLKVEEIAVALRRALSSAELRANLRQRGLARAAQFTWGKAAEKTIEVYHGLCCKR